MRQQLHVNLILLLIFGFTLISTYKGYTQNEKKKARVSLQYTKIMQHESFLIITVKFKGKNGFEKAKNLEFQVFSVLENDSITNIGKVITDMDGTGKFILDTHKSQIADSMVMYNYLVSVKNHSEFKDVEKSISFYDVNIEADLKVIDSTNYITAKLINSNNVAISGEDLKVRLKRLFEPLQIGKETYTTDRKGSIVVPIEDGIPGINGMLTFEVVLDESDTYGTVKKIINEQIGTPIVDSSTFDQRTMWSPPTKTPVFLWVFPNLIILGTWFTIVLLIFNLFKISKSKN